MKNPTLKISQLIKELENWKKSQGDLEVFMTNEEESVFDGVSKAFVILSARNDNKYLALLRNEDCLRI